MGGAASLIPEQIDIESFRILSGDNFNQEVFDGLKDENGCISQALLLDLNSLQSRLPRFTEAIKFYRKLLLMFLFITTMSICFYCRCIEQQNMQPITEAELPNLLKEVGLLPTVEGLSTQPTAGKVSFADFFKIVKERLSKIDTAVSDAFEMFDINRSGYISRQEMKKVMAQLGEAITNKTVDLMVRDADIDEDGKINIEEFQQKEYPSLSIMVRNVAQEMMKKMREENAALESFKVFDLDGDGFVTAQEIKTVLSKLGNVVTDEVATEMVKASDVDGDGRISVKEF